MKQLLLISVLLIFSSIACTAYRSSSSSSPAANTTENKAAVIDNSTESLQGNCPLTIVAAPSINGLRLRMTSDEVLALFAGSKEDKEVQERLSERPSEFGVTQFVIRPNKFQTKDNFADVTQITLNLLDGHVSSLNVGYAGPEYSHVDEFVTKFVAGKSLPPADQWQAYVGMDNSLKILKCTEFEIRVFAGGQGGNLNYVLMRDLVADKKLQARRKKAEESATPETKPPEK